MTVFCQCSWESVKYSVDFSFSRTDAERFYFVVFFFPIFSSWTNKVGKHQSSCSTDKRVELRFKHSVSAAGGEVNSNLKEQNVWLSRGRAAGAGRRRTPRSRTAMIRRTETCHFVLLRDEQSRKRHGTDGRSRYFTIETSYC